MGRAAGGRGAGYRSPGPAAAPCGSHDDQGETRERPPEPTLEERFVALPGHPWYGRRVQILGRRRTATSIRCIIQDGAHPGFHYQVPERWLLSSPPPDPAGMPAIPTVCLPLVA